MDPTTFLRDDHTTILFVLDAFEKVLGKTRATQRVDVQVVRDFRCYGQDLMGHVTNVTG